MSRIGKATIQVPKGVSVMINEESFNVKGPKGSLEMARVSNLVEVNLDSDIISVKFDREVPAQRMFAGTTRALLANMVQGVVNPFEKVLIINGVGYRSNIQGSKINFSLGYSHPIVFDLPKGVEAKQGEQANTLVIFGTDKQKVGQVSAEIRKLRPVEPYQGKGIRYQDEYVIRKEAKKSK